MRIIIFSTHDYEKPYLTDAAGEKHTLFFTRQRLTSFTAPLAEGFSAICISSDDDGSAPVLDILYQNGVRYIAIRDGGFDNVDWHYAEQLGIKIANVSPANPRGVAELGVGLLLNLNRKIQLGQRNMDKGDFRVDPLIGFNLFGKTVGIVGTGAIGSALVEIMNGFGCRIIGYDPAPNAGLVDRYHVQYATLKDLVTQADIVFIACPLNDLTKGMINRHVFRSMKPQSILINLGRGAVVKSMDLLEALEAGEIAAAGMDVYEFEKTIFHHYHGYIPVTDMLFQRLRSLPNVLITGHQGFMTVEGLQQIMEKTIENFSHWERKEEAPYEVKNIVY